MLDDGPTDLALQEYQDKIINTLEEMTANGLSENTIKSATYTLKRLNRETDLMNPETVKLYIGKLTVSNQTKQKLINNYEYFCKTNRLQWIKPIYHWDTKIPIIPLKQNVEAIISASTMKTATIFTILSENRLRMTYQLIGRRRNACAAASFFKVKRTTTVGKWFVIVPLWFK